MLSFRSFAALTALLLSLGACGQGAAVRIGDAYPRTGDNAEFLVAIQATVESAGVAIERWSVDRFQSFHMNTEQATAFADNKAVVGVVGHPGSRDALLGAVVYNVRGLPQVVPNATSRRVGAAGPWTFQLVPNDSVEGEFIAGFAIDSLHARRVSVLYVGDEYGLGLRDGVRTALRQRGQELVDDAVVPTQLCSSEARDEIHRAIAVSQLKRSRPDVVVLAASTQGSWCLADFIHEADPDVWILGADGMDGARDIPSRFTRVVPGRLRAVTYWTPGPDSLSQAFLALVRSKLGRDPNASEALQFDAFMVMAAAARDVGNDRRAVRSWLASLGESRPAWVGVTGAIFFNKPRSAILRMTGPQAANQ